MPVDHWIEGADKQRPEGGTHYVANGGFGRMMLITYELQCNTYARGFEAKFPLVAPWSTVKKAFIDEWSGM